MLYHNNTDKENSQLKKRFIYYLLIILLVGHYVMPTVSAQDNLDSNINAVSAISVDGANGQILFEKESEEVREVGAVSKALTLYMIYQAIDNGEITLNDSVSISDNAYRLSQDYGIANVPLRQDFTYSVDELLKAIAITQANGATLALVEHIAGTEDKFVARMQTQLKQWGMHDADIINTTGLPMEYFETGSVANGKRNRLNAQALAISSYHLLKNHPEFFENSQIKEAILKEDTDDPYVMTNFNRMITDANYDYDGIQGFLQDKNSQNQGNFLAVAFKNDFQVITVALESNTSETSYDDTKRLLDNVYAAFVSQKVVTKGEKVTQIGELISRNGDILKLNVDYANDVNLVVRVLDTTPRYNYKFIPNKDVYTADQSIKAPLKKGDVVGIVEISAKDTELDYLNTAKANNVNVILSEDLNEANFFIKAYRGTLELGSSALEEVRTFFTRLFN